MKTLIYKFSNLKKSVKQHSKMYKKINFKESYPANIKRLEIFLSLIKKYKPKKIIDAGCGSGMPLINIKKKGFNITGYDKAYNMVKLAEIVIFYEPFTNINIGCDILGFIGPDKCFCAVP